MPKLTSPIGFLCVGMQLSFWASGCVTANQPRIEPMVMAPKEFAKHNVELRRGEKELIKPQFSEEEAKAAFKFLCRGGKPHKAVKHEFKFVLPKPPKGSPLDQARDTTKSLQTLMKGYAASFYRLLAFGPVDERIQGIKVNSTYITEAPGPYPYLLASEKKADALISEFKSKSVKTKGDSAFGSDDPVGRILDGNESALAFLLFLGPGPKRPAVATILDVHEFPFHETANANGRQMVSTLPDTTELMPFELRAIREHYLMTVSEEEFSSWSQVAGQRMEGIIDASLGDEPIQGKAPLDQTELLDKADDVFTAYFVANTSIKQSTTDDGQVFAFNVALNTEPFCRMGRQKTMLQSN